MSACKTRSSRLSAFLGIAFAFVISRPAWCAVKPQAPAVAPQSGTETFTVQENVPYASVNGSELHLDVYEPAGRGDGTRPAVVLIHGGGWVSLDKRTMRGMGQFLARAGYVAFSHISKDDAPFLIVHGTEDQAVPISQAQELYEKLHSVGVPVSFVKVNDAHTFQTPLDWTDSFKRCTLPFAP
jgi:dipeptidyl aminopeptidase/acylaminoacyl peptidase